MTRRRLWSITPMLLLGLLLAGCGRPDRQPTRAVPADTIANVFQSRPAPGASLELDAYRELRQRPVATDGCPDPTLNSVLSDRPIPASVTLPTGYGSSDFYTADSPWLIAVADEQLPFHGLLRGHLDDPRFNSCPASERIFVVDEVLASYEPLTDWVDWHPDFSTLLPPDTADWLSLEDAAFGYRLRYPPAVRIEARDEPGVLHAQAITWEDGAMAFLRIHQHQALFDHFDRTLDEDFYGGYVTSFSQAHLFGLDRGGDLLAGYAATAQGDDGRLLLRYFFPAGPRTYELALAYAPGFDLPLAAMRDFAMMVALFEADAMRASDPTPTSMINQAIGAGPFMEQAAIERWVTDGYGADTQIAGSELLSEAEARRRCNACMIIGHPPAVWQVEFIDNLDGAVMRMRSFHHAATGKQFGLDDLAVLVTRTPIVFPTETPAPPMTYPYPTRGPRPTESGGPWLNVYPTPTR